MPLNRDFLECRHGDGHACLGRVVAGAVVAYVVVVWLAPGAWRFVLGFLGAM